MLATLLEDDTDRGDLNIPVVAPLDLIRLDDRPSDHVTCTDFLTAACGLVLGVGLATGPLYPDLIALVKTCLPRRFRPVRNGRSRPARNLRSWLGI